MRMPRNHRLILLAVAVASCLVVLVGAYFLGRPSTEDGVAQTRPRTSSTTAPRGTDSTAPRQGTLDDPALNTTPSSSPPVTNSTTSPPTTTPPVTTPPVTTPPATVPPTTAPAGRPAPSIPGASYTGDTNPYNYSYSGAPQAMCDVALSVLRSMGYDRGQQTSCASVRSSYGAEYSNGTVSGQVLANPYGGLMITRL